MNELAAADRPTLCYLRAVTHREMRNNGGQILRAVAAGESVTAGALAGRLRSHDAVHLAGALRAGADEMITYDAEFGTAASAAGLSVVRPS